jgi:hypothetical protein
MANAQWKISTQIGGANFLGATVNAAYSISLDNETISSLELAAGFGVLSPSHGNNSIINTHLNYIRKSWGFGVETAFFTKAPLYSKSDRSSFVDIMVYPNVNYTFNLWESFYLNTSAGLYLAWEQRSYGTVSNSEGLSFVGDPIPGAGITFGYIF